LLPDFSAFCSRAAEFAAFLAGWRAGALRYYGSISGYGGIMTVNNTTVVQSSGQSNWRSTVKQGGQDFAELFQAMQAGSLAGAQQAFGALQQLQGTAATDTTGTASTQSSATAAVAGTSSSGTNAIASDWTSLGQALQSGDMTSAQSAFGKLQSDLASAAESTSGAQGGHHHHHHHGGVGKAQAVYSAMQPGNATSTTQGTGSAVSTDIAGLKQALQSGDTSSAQDVLARLEQDLQSSAQSMGQRHHHGGFAAQSAGAGYQAGTTAAVAGTATA
jgi:hypothetical protein